MSEPQVKGRLLSECCDGLPWMDIYPEWSGDCWLGMCRTCKEHASFYDDAVEEGADIRAFNVEQQKLIAELSKPEEEA